jgi:hypothetical protein
MFDGQTLPAYDGTTETVVYSPWFLAVGDNVRCTLEILARSSANAQMTVDLVTKSTDTTGDGTVNGTSIQTSSIGRTTQEWTGLNQLVRYRFKFKNNTSVGSGSLEWMIFRMLTPVWFSTVKTT